MKHTEGMLMHLSPAFPIKKKPLLFLSPTRPSPFNNDTIRVKPFTIRITAWKMSVQLIKYPRCLEPSEATKTSSLRPDVQTVILVLGEAEGTPFNWSRQHVRGR